MLLTDGHTSIQVRGHDVDEDVEKKFKLRIPHYSNFISDINVMAHIQWAAYATRLCSFGEQIQT